MSLHWDQFLGVVQREAELHNLFSDQDRFKLAEKHLPDSLEILKIWNPQPDEKVLDLGTGGGFPGLVLAWERQKAEFTLCDATEKKLKALALMISDLPFERKPKLLWGRAEELGHLKEYREVFATVLARAVAPLASLLEYVSAFLKPGGTFYAWKGSDWKRELESSKNAQKELNLIWESTHAYTLSSGESRVILSFKKTKLLNPLYPRRTGIPKKSPL